ncbi:MAG: CPBP family intramembrane metalloprotease [Clostridia bacterium]|nr:CPBP family intramembrane metalloprotease [Clostridia bacterium]
MTGYEQTPAVIQPQKRHFRFRTIFLPLLFLAVHWLTINVTATLYVIFYALLHSQILNPLDLLSQQELVNQLLINHYPVISVIYSCLLIPIYSIYLGIQKKQDSQAIWLEKPHIHELSAAIAITIGLLGIINIWFNILMTLSESNPLINRWMKEYYESTAAFGADIGYLWLILGISIMTPIAEELLFRGIIQGELRKAMPEWAAIIVQGLVFAAFHWQPIQVSYVLLPGLALGLVYALTRSIWAPIIMHITFNFLGSVLPALIGEDEVLNQILGVSELSFILIGALSLIYLDRISRDRRQARVT